MWLNNRLNSNLLASCVVKYVHINILMYNMLEDSMNCDMCYVCYVGSSFALLVPFSVCVFKRPSSCSVDKPAIVQLWCSLRGLLFHCCAGGALWREGALDLKKHVKMQNFYLPIFGLRAVGHSAGRVLGAACGQLAAREQVTPSQDEPWWNCHKVSTSHSEVHTAYRIQFVVCVAELFNRIIVVMRMR